MTWQPVATSTVEWALKTVIFNGDNCIKKAHSCSDPEVVKDFELTLWHAMMILYRKGVHKDVVEHLQKSESWYVAKHAKELIATWPETK